MFANPDPMYSTLVRFDFDSQHFLWRVQQHDLWCQPCCRAVQSYKPTMGCLCTAMNTHSVLNVLLLLKEGVHLLLQIMQIMNPLFQQQTHVQPGTDVGCSASTCHGVLVWLCSQASMQLCGSSGKYGRTHE